MGRRSIPDRKVAAGPRGRPMTTSPPPGSAAAAGARVQTKITVPDDQQMVNLLGARDDVLKLVERSLNSDIHVRGNEITISGTPADNALAWWRARPTRMRRPVSGRFRGIRECVRPDFIACNR